MIIELSREQFGPEVISKSNERAAYFDLKSPV